MTESTSQPTRREYATGTRHWALLSALAVTAVCAPASAVNAEQPISSPGGSVAEKARKEAAERREAEEAALNASNGNAALIENPEVPDDTFYGPPVPKVEHGQLPEIAWTKPTGDVPPALEEAVNLVTANYPTAQSARAALRAAAADVRSAEWQRFPSFTAGVEYLDDTFNPQPQIVVQAPIWAGGRIDSQIHRAKAEETQSSAEYIETIQRLALQTSQTYFEVVRLTEREKLLEGSLKEHQALVATMERRVAQEISPQADLELARSRAAQIEQEYTVNVSQRRTTLRVLAELIADPTYDLGPIPNYDPELELKNREAFEEQAVTYSPTLKKLHAQTDIARADLDGRKASILPQLNAQYSYDDFYGSRVGLVVRAQNNGGLSQFADVDSARLRIQSSLEEIRAADQQLRRDIESALIAYDAAKKRAEISLTSSSTAARVSASYTRQFIAGRRSWLDVMNALREAVTAELGRSDAEVTVMATATQLLLQSGRWRPIFRDAGRN